MQLCPRKNFDTYVNDIFFHTIFNIIIKDCFKAHSPNSTIKIGQAICSYASLLNQTLIIISTDLLFFSSIQLFSVYSLSLSVLVHEFGCLCYCIFCVDFLCSNWYARSYFSMAQRRTTTLDTFCPFSTEARSLDTYEGERCRLKLSLLVFASRVLARAQQQQRHHLWFNRDFDAVAFFMPKTTSNNNRTVNFWISNWKYMI